MVKYRDLNPHPTRDLNPTLWCWRGGASGSNTKSRGGTFANSNTQGNTTTKHQTAINNKNNNLELQFRLPQPKRLEKATSQEVALFMDCVHVSEPALAACPGAVEGGMTLMTPSAVAEGVLAREASRRASAPACARAP